MSLDLLLDVYAAACGLVVGSYLNVVIFRLPRRISTVAPRSRCPRCRAPIRPWDNVPVLSYLLLRGRCRNCGGTIAWRYPLIEALTGACFLWSAERWSGRPLEIAVGCGFCAAMIVLAGIDVEHFLLPDVITLPGIAVGLLLSPWLAWTTPKDALLGVLLGAGFLYALTWLWYLWRRVWGMGLGDVKMLAMIGAFLGWQGVISTLFVSSLAGSLVGAGMMLLGRMHLRSKLPFGAFLAFGAVFSLFIGRDLLATYLRFAGGGLWM